MSMEVVVSVFAFLEGPDLIIVLIVVLVLFGGSQLPKLARSLGQAQRELKEGLRDGGDGADTPASDAATDHVTITRAEFDALLRAKDDEARTAATNDEKAPRSTTA